MATVTTRSSGARPTEIGCRWEGRGRGIFRYFAARLRSADTGSRTPLQPNSDIVDLFDRSSALRDAAGTRFEMPSSPVNPETKIATRIADPHTGGGPLPYLAAPALLPQESHPVQARNVRSLGSPIVTEAVDKNVAPPPPTAPEKTVKQEAKAEAKAEPRFEVQVAKGGLKAFVKVLDTEDPRPATKDEILALLRAAEVAIEPAVEARIAEFIAHAVSDEDKTEPFLIAEGLPATEGADAEFIWDESLQEDGQDWAGDDAIDYYLCIPRTSSGRIRATGGDWGRRIGGPDHSIFRMRRSQEACSHGGRTRRPEHHYIREGLRGLRCQRADSVRLPACIGGAVRRLAEWR